MAVVSNTKVTIDGYEITIVSASITQSASGRRSSSCSTTVSGVTGSCSCGFINNNSVAVTVPAGRITCHIYTSGNQVVCTGDNPTSFTLAAGGGTATKSWSLSNLNDITSSIGSTSRAAYVGVTGNSWSGVGLTLSGWSAGGSSAYLSSVSATSSAPTDITLTASGADYGCASSGYFYGSSDTVSGGGVAITSSRVSSSSSSPSLSFAGEATPNCTYRMAGHVQGNDGTGTDYSSTRYSSVTTAPLAPTAVVTAASGTNVSATVTGPSQGTLTVTVEMRYKSDDGSWSSWETVDTGDPNSSYTGHFTAPGTSGTVEMRYNGIGGTTTAVSANWVAGATGIRNMYGSTLTTGEKSERFEKVYGSVNGKSKKFVKVYGSVNGKSKLIYEE